MENVYYLLLYPLVFAAMYTVCAAAACFMRPADGYVSADSRMIYAVGMRSVSSVLSRLLFLRRHRLVSPLLAAGQMVNLLFAAFYGILCLFFRGFAAGAAVTVVSVHFAVILVLLAIIAVQHLWILSDKGKLH